MPPLEDTNAGAVRQELDRILASSEFASADLLRAFLKFVVETALDGDPSYLKESVIGTQVFGRPADYSPKLDPVVRMTARRLREKLDLYYSSQRAESPVRISLPKGGYVPQFQAAEAAEPPQAPATPQAVAPVLSEPAAAPVPPPSRASRAVILLATAGLLAGGYELLQKPGKTPAPAILDSRPFTSLTGHVFRPAFSPDGNAIAFDWDGPDKGQQHVWVQKLGADTPTRVTANPAKEACAAWLPDGRRVAFLRSLKPGREAVVSVSLDGAGEQQHAEIQTGPNEDPGLSWSPDGQSLVTAERPSPGQPAALVVVTPVGSKRRLTDPPQSSGGDTEPAFSPDGRQIAFRRTISVTVEDVYVVDLSGAHLRRITYDNRGIGGIAWTNRGRSLVFSSKRAGSASSLWQVPIEGGVPERLTPIALEANEPTISRAGRLAFVRGIYDVNIWEMERGSSAPAHPLIASTLLDSGPQFSPDGARIAFRSTRSGSDEVWIYDSSTQSATRLTNMGGPLTGSARWAPDGRRLAFESHPGGKSDIYLIEATGGSAQIVTNETGSHILPSWSRDGASVYFTSDRSGRWEVWRNSLSGAPSEQITHEGGLNAFEAPDGKWLYYPKPHQSGLWRMPVGGGIEELVLSDLNPSFWGNWAVAPQGIYYIRRQPSKEYAVIFYDFKTRASQPIHTLSAPPAGSDSGLAVSPDGRTILFCQVDADGSNILLSDGLSQ